MDVGVSVYAEAYRCVGMIVEFGRGRGGDTLGGVACVGIDLATCFAICRGNDGEVRGTKIDGGEVEAPDGVGVPAFCGAEGECAGEAINGG